MTARSVLVLRGAGPKGAPGMPEWGMLPIPRKLLAQGVTDMVRISDARMSGTGYGTVVLHVAPESAAGGPLAAVADGDEIVLDTPARRLDLCVAPRRDRPAPRPRGPPPSPPTGAATAASTSTTCCRPTPAPTSTCSATVPARPATRPEGPTATEPYGLLEGWISGW